ncbi:MAG: hypothetical protein V3T81_08425 [Thermoanaerobaculia bacterium]
MKYRVTLKRLTDRQYYARCVSAPSGLAEAYGDTPDEALGNLRKEIRFQLEYCPCSGVARDYVELDVTGARPGRYG